MNCQEYSDNKENLLRLPKSILADMVIDKTIVIDQLMQDVEVLKEFGYKRRVT